MLVFQLSLQGQKVLSYHQFIQGIRAADSRGYVLEDAQVRFQASSDARYLKASQDSLLQKVGGGVSLKKVQFIGPGKMAGSWERAKFYLSGLHIEGEVFIEGCVGDLPKIERLKCQSLEIRSSGANTIEVEEVAADWISVDDNKVKGLISLKKVKADGEEWSRVGNNISSSIDVDSCQFTHPTYISENSVEKTQIFEDQILALNYGWTPEIITLRNNVFKSTLTVDNNQGDQIIIENNQLGNKCFFQALEPSKKLSCKNNTFQSSLYVQELQSVDMELIANKFISDSIQEHQLRLDLIQLSGRLDIRGNVFENPKADYGIFIGRTNATYMVLGFNTIKVPLIMINCNARSRFALSRNTLSKPVLMGAMSYGTQSFINWDELKDFLAAPRQIVYANTPLDSAFHRGQSRRILEEGENYKRLLQLYSELRNLYRAQGNLADANELEVLLGDLRLRRYRMDYVDNPSLQSYFNWKVNDFMRVFTAYGTNPIIAILYSGRIIFLFALFYMLFHNQWDHKTRGKLARRLRLVLNYFRSKEDLNVHLEKELTKDRSEQKELEQAYHRSANKVPPFFLKLTELYFRYLSIKPSLRQTFLKRTELLSGTWNSLPAGRKYWVASVLSLWFSLYLLWFGLSKFLNALALSVNAFTTLGFGYIPTEGISRYVLILEGLLGWLMMSIFSVTLISQIIG